VVSASGTKVSAKTEWRLINDMALKPFIWALFVIASAMLLPRIFHLLLSIYFYSRLFIPISATKWLLREVYCKKFQKGFQTPV